MLTTKRLIAYLAFFVGALAGAMVGAQSAQAEPIQVCPGGRSAVATADTSCAFADNVASAWYGQPGRVVYAYSPVTRLVYTMNCSPDAWTSRWGEAKRCFGYNSFGVLLVVYVD